METSRPGPRRGVEIPDSPDMPIRCDRRAGYIEATIFISNIVCRAVNEGDWTAGRRLAIK
jgi:hypothetical protein